MGNRTSAKLVISPTVNREAVRPERVLSDGSMLGELVPPDEIHIDVVVLVLLDEEGDVDDGEGVDRVLEVLHDQRAEEVLAETVPHHRTGL